MSKEKTVVITSAVRTAIGSLGGTLKNVPAYKLGSTVISNAIEKSNLKPTDINEVIMGQVLTGGTGQNPARQASMDSGIPKETPSLCCKSSLWFWLKIYCFRFSIYHVK